MEPWIRVQLSSQDIANRAGFRLQDQFEAVFMQALSPADAAMFCNRSTVGGEFSYYFSPGARRIFALSLATWNPSECPRPSRDEVTLLVGHASAPNDLLGK